MLSAETAREMFDYSPETGELTWQVRRGSRWQAARPAGCLNAQGYRVVRVFDKLLYAHRIAWLIVHGEWPDTIDHINGCRSDNALANLRSCTQAENKRNVRTPRHNRSGTKGVSWDKRAQKWRAQINTSGRYLLLGRFDTVEEAASAYAVASQKLHGEFGRAA